MAPSHFQSLLVSSVPTAWTYSIQFGFCSPQLHLHPHSSCHLNNETYPLTRHLHWHQFWHQKQAQLQRWCKTSLAYTPHLSHWLPEVNLDRHSRECLLLPSRKSAASNDSRQARTCKVIWACSVLKQQQKTGIREFVVPTINFDAGDYIDIINWSDVYVTVPPLLSQVWVDEISCLVSEGNDSFLPFLHILYILYKWWKDIWNLLQKHHGLCVVKGPQWLYQEQNSMKTTDGCI